MLEGHDRIGYKTIDIESMTTLPFACRRPIDKCEEDHATSYNLDQCIAVLGFGTFSYSTNEEAVIISESISISFHYLRFFKFIIRSLQRKCP